MVKFIKGKRSRDVFHSREVDQMGNEWGRSMRDRRGSGPALLNVPVFTRAVKLSMQSGWQAWTYTESCILTTLYLSNFNIWLNAGEEICYFSSARLSTRIVFLSASASVNYVQVYFIFLIAVRLGFTANIGFVLPVQEFPLWNRRVRRGKSILCRGTPTVLFV